MIADIEQDLQQIVFTPILNNWSQRQKSLETLVTEAVLWVYRMEHYLDVPTEYDEYVRTWKLWKKPRMSTDMVECLVQFCLFIEIIYESAMCYNVSTFQILYYMIQPPDDIDVLWPPSYNLDQFIRSKGTRPITHILSLFYSDLKTYMSGILSQIKHHGVEMQTDLSRLVEHLRQFEDETEMGNKFVR